MTRLITHFHFHDASVLARHHDGTLWLECSDDGVTVDLFLKDSAQCRELAQRLMDIANEADVRAGEGVAHA